MLNISSGTAAFILIGAYLIVSGIYKWIRYAKLAAYGIKTDGTVIAIEGSSDGEASIDSPIISYFGSNGVQITKPCDRGSTPPLYNVGDSVIVIYDADENEVFTIDDIYSRVSGPVMIVIGAAIISVCLYIVFYGPNPFR